MNAPTLTAWIRGIGVLGPGLAGWSDCAAALRGAGYQPAPTLLPAAEALPPAERRRAGRWVRLALAVGAQAVSSAGAEAATLASVFSSSSADGDTCHQICETLASSERAISPTRFHNSVHNAASGYWSIAQRSPLPSTALCAFDASFGAGLLEALAQVAAGAPAVLLVCGETDYPPPMRAARPVPDAFGIALLLSGQNELRAPRLRVTLCEEAPTHLARQELEALRRALPAARGLPLLESLALERSEPVVLDYLDDLRLRVQVSSA